MSTRVKKPHALMDVLGLYILDRTPSEATIDSYKKFINVFERDTQIIEIRKIDKHLLNLWKRDLLLRVRPISANTYLRHIKTLLRFSFDEGYINTNPFKKFRMCKTPDKPFKSIINEDLKTALEVIDSNILPPSWFWKIVVYSLFYTGIRRRQLVGLEWKDINISDKTIELRSKNSKTGKEWTIPIHDELLPHLKKLKEKTQDCYGAISIDDLQVFNVTIFNLKYSGSKMTSEQLSGFFRNLQKKSRINISAHRFRHRLATDLTKNNNRIKDVQVILGHRDIKSTLVYVTTDIKQMRDTLTSLSPI